MTTTVESPTEQGTDINDRREAVMAELQEVGNIVARGEAAKERRVALMKEADELGIGPTRIAAAAKVTRKMVYHNRNRKNK